MISITLRWPSRYDFVTFLLNSSTKNVLFNLSYYGSHLYLTFMTVLGPYLTNHESDTVIDTFSSPSLLRVSVNFSFMDIFDLYFKKKEEKWILDSADPLP